MVNKEWNKFLAERYGLEEYHFWFHKQSEKWIVSHKGCMVIAEKENIKFGKPEYVQNETDRIVMFGTATISDEDGNSKEVWTHGEANHKNCYMPYPFAMAEKRLKDRLTLQIISAYGEVYSEIEAEEFAAESDRYEKRDKKK
jgi:hypothetical protein